MLHKLYTTNPALTWVKERFQVCLPVIKGKEVHDIVIRFDSNIGLVFTADLILDRFGEWISSRSVAEAIASTINTKIAIVLEEIERHLILTRQILKATSENDREWVMRYMADLCDGLDPYLTERTDKQWAAWMEDVIAYLEYGENNPDILGDNVML